MGVYYVIRDGERLRAIHNIRDSSEAAFHELTKMPEETGPRVLELICIATDQFGKVLQCILVCSWTRRSGVIVTHMTDITGDFLLV